MRGSIRQKEKGKNWYYSFEVATVDGKRKRIERVGGRTKKEAEMALRKALDEYESTGQHFTATELSFSDYLDYWMEKYVATNCKNNTIMAYDIKIRLHLKPVLGKFKLKSITPQMIQEFLNDKFKEGVSKSTLKGLSSILTSSFKYAVQPCRYVKENPVQAIRLPKYDSVKQNVAIEKYISPEEFNWITERYPMGTVPHIPFQIAYHTGMRIGEVLALTWNDIDFERKIITISKTQYVKGKFQCIGTPKSSKSNRTIKVGDTLINILKLWKTRQDENRDFYGEYYHSYHLKKDEDIFVICKGQGEQPTDFICTHENGKIAVKGSLTHATEIIKRKLGNQFSSHSLRHTHATLLIQAGANIKNVQARLGHHKIETTLNTYVHNTDSMSEETVDLFEKINFPTKIPTVGKM